MGFNIRQMDVKCQMSNVDLYSAFSQKYLKCANTHNVKYKMPQQLVLALYM